MNFTQMHDHLRVELLRRIERGTLSVSLLARQTGFGQSHLSNFLHHRAHLSLNAIDCILASQHIAVADLLPSKHANARPSAEEDISLIPVVSHTAALFEPLIRPAAVQEVLQIPSRFLLSLRRRSKSVRHTRQRFVSVRVSSADAESMDPLILPDALAVIDRHYSSLFPYRSARATLYAVRIAARLAIRYVDFRSDRLVLRPHNIAFPVELVETAPGESPNDLIVGRVAFILNET